jgi:hypothetical protein
MISKYFLLQNTDSGEYKYGITPVMKTETEMIISITVILMTNAFNTFKNNIVVFIDDIIMCLTSHWQIFSVSKSVHWYWQYHLVRSKDKCQNYWQYHSVRSKDKCQNYWLQNII